MVTRAGETKRIIASEDVDYPNVRSNALNVLVICGIQRYPAIN